MYSIERTPDDAPFICSWPAKSKKGPVKPGKCLGRRQSTLADTSRQGLATSEGLRLRPPKSKAFSVTTSRGKA